MAKFLFNGMDGLSASFEELIQLSDDERMSVIMPGAEVLAERQRESIKSRFRQRSGALAASLAIQTRSDDAGAYAYITLTGKHPSSSTGRRKRKDGRGNGRYSGTNAEVGYILEYGSPRIAATHWMETANEDAADEAIAAQQKAWDDLITKKGL